MPAPGRSKRAFYTRVFGPLDRRSSEQLIKQLETQLAALATLNVQADFECALPAFTRLFPALRANFKVIALPSLGRFAGQARPWDESEILLVGVDQIPRDHRDCIPASFLHHELAHLYHYQVCPEVRAGAKAFFYFPRVGQNPIPINCGYVIGERIVNEMAKGHSLPELVRLQGPDLNRKMTAAVKP